MRNNSLRNFVIALCVCACAACSSNVVFESTITPPNAVWSKEDIAVFTFTPRDTLTQYDIILSIRNTNDYAYSNLFVFSEIRFPNRQFTRDTIEFVLADAQGEWTGKRWFSSHTNTFNFKQGVRFPYEGEYTFLLEQAMRCTNKDCALSGIEKITVQIVER